MPPRARQSAKRRQRSSGSRVSSISSRRVTASCIGNSETETSAKRHRTRRPQNGGRSGSDSSGSKRWDGSRESATITPPFLDMPDTSVRASRVSNTHDHETDEDEASMLQRFSNMSERPRARGMSPPNLASTPPPSPHRVFDGAGDAERATHVSPVQHGDRDALSLERIPVPALSVRALENTASARIPARVSTSSQSTRSFSPALLSQLLLAEAVRAEAAAAAVAQQQDHDRIEYGSYTSMEAFGTPTPSQDSQMQPSMTTTVTTHGCRIHRDWEAAPQHKQMPKSPLSSVMAETPLPMDDLVVSIGVVPLPDGETVRGNPAPRERSRWWPRSLTSPMASPNAAGGTVREAACDQASCIAKDDGNAAEARWHSVCVDPTASVHRLRPLRLYTSDQQRTAIEAPSRSSTSPTLHQSTEVTAALMTSKVASIDPSGRTVDVLGWSRVIAGIPLVLPGARLTNRREATGSAVKESKEVDPRDGDRGGSSESEAMVCSGAASISVILV
ncbi:hypothetical protein, conserved [Leishmania tarentolae]|uniref:Uncharacterized protein n=1 Tax=Leishmania tarentolae TaxID=5689 RepID=A0A640KFB3_LEITA|nr:hypothetical protein, conserved [Leishmania tarentolae]